MPNSRVRPGEMQSAASVSAVPNPDPTVRTVETLQRDIQASREIVEATNKGTREVLETRLAGMDMAIELLQKATDKIPGYIKGAVAHLQALHDERFSSVTALMDTRFDGIGTQFAERDKRTEQLSLADKTAIAAALQAQKEDASAKNESNATATAKMEANFAKLIEQGQTLLMEVRRNTEAQINDLKSRLDKGEGTSKGKTEGVSAVGAIILGVFVGLSTLASVASLIFAAVRAH